MKKDKICVLIPPAIGLTTRLALDEFQNSLRKAGISCRTIDSGECGKNEVAVALELDPDAGDPDHWGNTEAFSIVKIDDGAVVKVIGGGETGLAYGLFELLGQIESSREGVGVLEAIAPTSRSPELQVRSINLFLHNSDLEEEWLYSREFWSRYFPLLAKSRFNFFTLTFAHQTAYFAPLFPFMIDVPGYEHVEVPSYTEEDKAKNLAMLTMVSEMAEQWGIKFILGIWQQHAHVYGDNMVVGLGYRDLFDYNPKALGLLLSKCPKIKGVQFRMNIEAGIKEDDQEEFFGGILPAIKNCGREMWIDLRAKGLREETIQTAERLDLDFVVSTKFWCEHMGMPYFATQINPEDRRKYRRYGYWDLLRHDRPYEMIFRMWTLGSSKILLWGDLDYAGRFAKSCHLGDALGFEVCAPLSNKGYGNWHGGQWHVIEDHSREHYQWEFERYWAFYMAFGLSGYSPEVGQPVFSGEFSRRFGDEASPHVQAAYRAASAIIPLITVAHAPSGGNFGHWPELDIGGLTDAYVATPTGDEGRFYSITRYVDDYMAGRVTARLTPSATALRLTSLADSVVSSLDQAQAEMSDSDENKEFRLTCIDLNVTAGLARYHAARLLSGESFQFFRKSGERYYLLRAIRYAQNALYHWRKIVDLSDGVYYPYMVFNHPPGQIGHWKDELPLLAHDLDRLEEIDSVYLEYCGRPEEAGAIEIEQPWYRQTVEWRNDGGTLRRSVGDIVPAEPLPFPVYEGPWERRNTLQKPRSVIKDLLGHLGGMSITHVPLRVAEGNSPVAIHVSLVGQGDGEVTLKYRIVGLGDRFISLPMQETDRNVYTALIPATAPGNRIRYFVQATDKDGKQVLSGSAEKPHSLTLGRRNEKPTILHDDIRCCDPWEDLVVRVTVRTPLTLSEVSLHYRRLVQVDDWTVVRMQNIGGHTYEATIPSTAISEEWDLMYAVEAVDEYGNAAFYPDCETDQPSVFVRTSPDKYEMGRVPGPQDSDRNAGKG